VIATTHLAPTWVLGVLLWAVVILAAVAFHLWAGRGDAREFDRRGEQCSVTLGGNDNVRCLKNRNHSGDHYSYEHPPVMEGDRRVGRTRT
jgi:hypothetical protein